MSARRRFAVGIGRLARRLRAVFRGNALLRVERVEELPERLSAGRVYVVGENDHEWYAALLCPCGCSAVVELNLLSSTRPRWRLRVRPGGTASLRPSIWRRVGCQSHFWVLEGRVHWVRADIGGQEVGLRGAKPD